MFLNNRREMTTTLNGRYNRKGWKLKKMELKSDLLRDRLQCSVLLNDVNDDSMVDGEFRLHLVGSNERLHRSLSSIDSISCTVVLSLPIPLYVNSIFYQKCQVIVFLEACLWKLRSSSICAVDSRWSIRVLFLLQKLMLKSISDCYFRDCWLEISNCSSIDAFWTEWTRWTWTITEFMFLAGKVWNEYFDNFCVFRRLIRLSIIVIWLKSIDVVFLIRWYTRSCWPLPLFRYVFLRQ